MTGETLKGLLLRWENHKYANIIVRAASDNAMLNSGLPKEQLETSKEWHDCKIIYDGLTEQVIVDNIIQYEVVIDV